MTQTILIILGIVVIALLVVRKSREQILRPARDKIAGICAIALGQTAKKGENKKKILAPLGEVGLRG